MSSSKIMVTPAKIELPMPIITPRLILRPIQAGDEKIIHEAKCESWTELHPWMVWTWRPLNEMTVEENEPFCRTKQELFASRADITLLAFNKENGRLIGSAALHKCDWEKRTFIVGFWIRTSETRKGYAVEAAAAVSHYAFKALQANTIFTCHHEGNLGSQKVIEKIGFQRDATLDGQHDLHGHMVNEYWYGLSDDKKLPPLKLNWGSAPSILLKNPSPAP